MPNAVPMLKSERIRLTLAIAAVVPAGLVIKFCVPGALGKWCNLYGAAVLCEVCWVLVLRLVLPRLAPLTCGAIVFVVTCALEFLQLWHPPALDAVRRTFLGAALLGTSFERTVRHRRSFRGRNRQAPGSRRRSLCHPGLLLRSQRKPARLPGPPAPHMQAHGRQGRDREHSCDRHLRGWWRRRRRAGLLRES